MRKRILCFYSSSSSRHNFVFDAFGCNTSRPEQTHEYDDDDDDEWWYFKNALNRISPLVLLLIINTLSSSSTFITHNELF